MLSGTSIVLISACVISVIIAVMPNKWFIKKEKKANEKTVIKKRVLKKINPTGGLKQRTTRTSLNDKPITNRLDEDDDIESFIDKVKSNTLTKEDILGDILGKLSDNPASRHAQIFTENIVDSQVDKQCDIASAQKAHLNNIDSDDSWNNSNNNTSDYD